MTPLAENKPRAKSPIQGIFKNNGNVVDDFLQEKYADRESET
jgi:hypothetical protein